MRCTSVGGWPRQRGNNEGLRVPRQQGHKQWKELRWHDGKYPEARRGCRGSVVDLWIITSGKGCSCDPPFGIDPTGMPSSSLESRCL